MTEYRDVIIVGGGLAGLSAAYKLAEAGGASYVLLESQERLGGRTITRECDREFGAGYVGQAQNYVQYLIRALGIETVRTYLEQTQHWLYHTPDNRIEVYPGDNPLDFPGIPNALYKLGEIDMLVLEVRHKLHEPWTLPPAIKQHDQRTVQEWIDDQRTVWDEQPEPKNPALGMSPETAAVFTASVRAAFSLEPAQVSFLFLLYYAAAAGSYSALVDIAGGEGTAEGTRFRYGTQDLVARLAERVGLDNISTGTPVSSVESRGEEGVVVTTVSGQSWTAKKVIVALSPPASIHRITYGALLEDQPEGRYRKELCTRMAKHLGQTIKGFVRFKGPVWRERGQMGYMLSMADWMQFPIGWTLDNVWEPTPGSPCAHPRYSLMTFIGGAAATHWSRSDLETRANAVIDHLHRVFGTSDADLFHATRADNYEEENWPAQNGAGVPAPAAMMPPNTLSDPDLGRALRRPLDNVHWASSEAGLEWCGYMDGAIESGFRAAAEVLRCPGAAPATASPGP